MMNRIASHWERPPTPNRLERWLDRKLRVGSFAAFPPYAPPGDRRSHCPDQFARALLARMRSAADDPATLERVKDDARAFRSWAEAVVPAAV
jgi:hypothetical protein